MIFARVLSSRTLDAAIGFPAAAFVACGMALDIAQEIGPEGVHVAHGVIDRQIDTPGVRDQFPDREDEMFLAPDEMAEAYWHLVEQDDDRTQQFEVHSTNGRQNSEFICPLWERSRPTAVLGTCERAPGL